MFSEIFALGALFVLSIALTEFGFYQIGNIVLNKTENVFLAISTFLLTNVVVISTIVILVDVEKTILN